jgi:hypothetical protein
MVTRLPTVTFWQRKFVEKTFFLIIAHDVMVRNDNTILILVASLWINMNLNDNSINTAFSEVLASR